MSKRAQFTDVHFPKSYDNLNNMKWQIADMEFFAQELDYLYS